MTKDKAKTLLDNLIGMVEDNQESDYDTALKMGIQALSQEPTDTWSIKDVADTFKKHGLIREQEPCDDAEQIDYHDDFKTASRKIHDYEERQKQNDRKRCRDCQLIGTDSCYMVCGGSKSLYKPKQKQEPCTDAVSRQAVLDYLKVNVDDFPDYHEAIEKVLQMPPVTQKSGKWIPIYQGDEIINYRCSECELGDTNGSTNLYGWDYCRRCGAKMVEPQESEDKERIKAIPSAEPNMTWVTGADGAKIAFKDVPVWKVTKICEILGEPQESEDKE